MKSSRTPIRVLESTEAAANSLEELVITTLEKARGKPLNAAQKKGVETIIRKLLPSVLAYETDGEAALIRALRRTKRAPRWIYAAYYTLVMSALETPEKRRKLMDQLFEKCPANELDAVQRLVQRYCASYTCTPMNYWDIFSNMPRTCYLTATASS